MAYGSGKRLGETIDPRLMMADFSGFERAGQIMGQGFANAGKQIGDTIKENTQKQNDISAGIKMATAIKQAVPELSPIADEVLGQLSNPDISTNQKIQSLAGIKEAMQISLLGKQENRADAALAIQKAELAAKLNTGRDIKPPQTIELPVAGGTETLYWNQSSGKFEPVSGIVQNIAPPIKGQKTDANAVNQGLNMPSTNYPDGVITEGTPLPMDGMVLPPKEEPIPRIGFKPNAQTENFRPANQEEIAYFGVPGQVDVKTNKFYPVNPPKGMSIKTNPDGTFEFVEGAGAGQKTEDTTRARKRMGEQGLGVVLENLGSVFDKINEVSGSAIGAAAQAQIANILPASEIGSIKDQIETVNNNISFDTVNQLRAASTTGSAGGNITEKEWSRFEGRFGKIYVGQNKDLFTKNVKSIAYTMYDAVNGTPEEVDKLLDENKITQQDYNNYLEGRSALRTKFGAINSSNPIEQSKEKKATDNPLKLSQEAEEILKGLPK